MKLTARQLRKLVEATVTDLGQYRAEKTKQWRKVGTYTGTGMPGSISVEVSNHGELGLTMDELTVVLSTTDAAALLDHVRRALDEL
jgi:hypothetical protein